MILFSTRSGFCFVPPKSVQCEWEFLLCSLDFFLSISSFISSKGSDLNVGFHKGRPPLGDQNFWTAMLKSNTCNEKGIWMWGEGRWYT